MEFKKLMLKDVIKNIFSGGTPRTGNPEYWDGDLLWLSSGETRSRYITTTEKKITKKAVEESSTRLAKENSIVIASAGQGHTRGQTSFLLKPMYINQSVIAIEADPDIVLSKYLFYNISGRYRELRHISDSSSSRGSLTGKILKDLPIDVPPLKIQNNVVNFIDSVDKRIELNKKIIANLEELSQTLFKRWFVDFEFPDENGNPYKSSGGEMYSTRLGEIPITFYPGTLKDLLNIKSGYAFKSSWWVDSGVPVIKIKDIQDNGIDLKNLSYVAPVHASKANDFTVRGGEILMALTGATVSKNYIVPLLSEPALVNQRVGLVTKSNSFKYSLLNLHLIRNEIIERAHGSAQPNVSPKNILAINFPIPNTNTIEDFLTKTRGMYEMISIKSYENTQLARLRDYLLPKLMSGEIELSEGLEADEHAELLQ